MAGIMTIASAIAALDSLRLISSRLDTTQSRMQIDLSTANTNSRNLLSLFQ